MSNDSGRHRNNSSLGVEESTEITAENHEQMSGIVMNASDVSDGNAIVSENIVTDTSAPKSRRFSGLDRHRSSRQVKRQSMRQIKRQSQVDNFVQRRRSSLISPLTFDDEDAVNPFELDLEDRSVASDADENECDYYKPLVVADQMGRSLRFNSKFKLNSQSMGSTSNDSDSNKGKDKSTTAITYLDIDLESQPTGDSQRKGDKAAGMKSRSVLTAGLESFKYLYSLALLIFCIVLVFGTIFTKQTKSTSNGFPPIAAFFIFCFLIFWLAMMEGGQGALVGLQPIDRERYRDSHPRAYKTTGVISGGDADAESNKLECFIVGRQFLVVLVVFLSSLLSSTVADVQLWGLGETSKLILLDSGIAVMVVTIVVGQLLAQLNAANCMLDFINNYFMLYFVTYPSLIIEFSGLLHSVYLVQMLFSKIGGGSKGNQDAAEATENKKEKCRTILQSVFFWARAIFSLVVLGFAFAVTLSALFKSQTTMWKSVPNVVSAILFFGLMCFVGMMEGMQIALFAVINYPEKEFDRYRVARKNCQLAFQGENLQSFLIGRQICVTICMFIIARIATLNVQIGVDENIFGVSNEFQAFLNTGLLGAVITTIVSSLAWRIIASSFPLPFLSNPIVNLIMRLCLLFEASGVCSSAWVLARYHKILVKYQPDNVYLNDAEPTTVEPNSTRDKDIDRFMTVVRFSYSLALFFFSVTVVTASIFTKNTTTTTDKDWYYSILAFVGFWLLVLWLAMIEGGLGCLMGLKTVDGSNYTVSHPFAFKNTSIAHKGNNMRRFIVGRQLLVLIIIFFCTWLMEPVPDVSILGLPNVVNEIFLSSDLALVIILVVAGQLTAEVHAATCMLDFVNNRFMLFFVTYLSLAIEYSGLLHSVYLVQILFSKISGKSRSSDESSLSLVQKVFFWGRVVASISILGFAVAVTSVAVINGQASLWESLPDAATLSIILILICVVGMMEGVQIALFGIASLTDEGLESHKIAFVNYKLAFSGQNLQAFLIGRQICVTCFFVLIARMSTLNVIVGEDENVFGVPNGVQKFFNTGIFGALLTTIMASLMWRLFASSFPIAFMSNPLIYVIIWLCLIVEASGICSACWVFGRWTKLIFGRQSDPVYLENLPKEGSKPITRRDKDIDVTATVIQYICSTILLCFGIAVTVALIFTKQTKLSSQANPWIPFVLFLFLLLYLAMMEGGQGCLVGLQGIEKDIYKDSHNKSFKNTMIAHKGDNMQRFIVGRQFLVVLCCFVISLCGSPVPGSAVFRLPDIVSSIFIDSGVSLILITVILGQLTAQVNAASCMLDFINNYFMLYFVTYVSMAIEMSGLLHCVYLVQILFSKITGTTVESNEPVQTLTQKVFFWGRAMLSLGVLIFSFVVTLNALFDGKTTSWDNLPGSVSVVIFLALMCIAGLMEGMQIALFAVVNLPEEELAQHKMAKSICQLTFSGNNLQAFLIGRQIFVTLCTFVIARITTLNVQIGVDDNIFGVPDGLQAFFNTGLLGAIITTVVGSLAWRIIAASFPVAFLSNPVVYLILRLCLVLEASGICSAAWLLALIHKQIAGFQPDEAYISCNSGEKDDTTMEGVVSFERATGDDLEEKERKPLFRISCQESQRALQTQDINLAMSWDLQC